MLPKTSEHTIKHVVCMVTIVVNNITETIKYSL